MSAIPVLEEYHLNIRIKGSHELLKLTLISDLFCGNTSSMQAQLHTGHLSAKFVYMKYGSLLATSELPNIKQS